jgi:predicted ATP-grasp superfamily ATP-dependent carboligase
MMRLLLTGARTPSCLELSRQLHRAGHAVFVADSFAEHLCHGSRSLAGEFVVPSARHATEAFVRSLVEIVEREGIEVLIPTCEEILYITAWQEAFESRCRVFADSFETLLTLHDKWRFARRMVEIGLRVPNTALLRSEADMVALFARGEGSSMVLKPAFSRYGARAVICPGTREQAARVRPSEIDPWVAQEFVEGRLVCTYGVAHAGRLAAHVTYPVGITLPGGGPTAVYEPIEHPAALEFGRRLVKRLAFTGQFGLDFVESADGELWAIECNPRSTGGVHCFDGTPGFAAALLGDFAGTLSPADLRPRMLTAAMLFTVPRGLRSWAEFRLWAHAIRRARGVVHRWGDPRPTAQQFAEVAYFGRLARRVGIDTPGATTWDLEFDGAAAAAALQRRQRGGTP